MGDRRFDGDLRELVGSPDAATRLCGMSDAGIVQALAAASKVHDPYLANVLATEALNRLRHRWAVTVGITAGSGAVIAVRTAYLAWLASRGGFDAGLMAFNAGTLVMGGGIGYAVYRVARRT